MIVAIIEGIAVIIAGIVAIITETALTPQVKARRGAEEAVEDITDVDGRRELYIAGFSSFVSSLAKELCTRGF